MICMTGRTIHRELQLTSEYEMARKFWYTTLYRDSEVAHVIWWQQYMRLELTFLVSTREIWYAFSVGRYVYLFIIWLVSTVKKQNGQIWAQDPNQMFLDERPRQQIDTLRTEVRPTRFCIQSFSSGKMGQTVQNWFCNMRRQSEAWPTPSDLGSSLAAFLLEFLFASTRQMSRHSRTSHNTIK
jgi:hypothetical protein